MRRLKGKFHRFAEMARRAASLFLAVCLLSAALPLKALADGITVNYVTLGICGGFIRVNQYTGVLDNVANDLVGDLVIPAEVEGVKITAIGPQAFYDQVKLTSVTVPPSVKTIGDGAFSACTSLKSVKIPEGVTYLGKEAFRYCYSLTEVSLPSTLAEINDYTFSSCLALPSITVPSGVDRLGDYAFSNCEKLVSVSLPATVVAAGTYCFSGCKALKEINLPVGFTNLPTALFSGCSALEKLIVPEGVQRISDLVFQGCAGLRSLSLPDSVTGISGSAFSGCSNQLTFYVNAGSNAQAFAAANNIPYKKLEELPDVPDDGVGNYPETPFTDDKGHWAQDYVEWAYALGYIAGTSDTTFSPGMPISRGQIVTILYRMEGCPSVKASSFTDLAAGKYYVDGVAWAESTKVVSGIGNGKFGPNLNITREQLAAMLYRYAGYKGKSTSARGNLSEFRDNADVSNFAGTAMSWAVGSGIISGKSNAMLDPKGNASRAEAAVMLQKFTTLK